MPATNDGPAGPPPPFQDMTGQETAPLTDGTLLRYQYIALAPTVATNFRYVLHDDGRLYFAQNSSAPNDPIYNTPLPSEPTRTLSESELAAVNAALDAVDFFNQPALVSVKARGGALMVVAARRGDMVHEVWYENGNNPLLELLHGLALPEENTPTTVQDSMAYWDAVWEDMSPADDGDEDE